MNEVTNQENESQESEGRSEHWWMSISKKGSKSRFGWSIDWSTLKVNVGEKEATRAVADGGWLKAGAVPVDVDAVVVDAEVVCAPVDERVVLGEPGFTQEEVVFFQWVDNGIEVGGVLLAM